MRLTLEEEPENTGPRTDDRAVNEAPPPSLQLEADPAVEDAKPRKKAASNPLEALRRDVTPLDQKVTWLALGSLAAGLSIGAAEAALGHQFWPMLVMAAVAGAALVTVGRCWIADPWTRLLRVLPGVTRELDRKPATMLPTQRQDEVGQVARALRDTIGRRIAHHHDARSLRRTLDQRVQQSVRRATAELKGQASRDPLTGAGNRRFLDEQLPDLIDLSLASDTELIVMAFDMDCFKQVNDQLGHATGDDLLILLADLVRGSLRDDDLLVRLGGDEFLVIQPGGDLQQAEQFAQRLRRLYLHQTKHLADQLEGDLKPNLSIGIAGLFADGLNTDKALLMKADQRVYAAKNAGRGRTATPLGLCKVA